MWLGDVDLDRAELVHFAVFRLALTVVVVVISSRLQLNCGGWCRWRSFRFMRDVSGRI